MVAKCSILNQTQFNGRFGCPDCTMSGRMAQEKQTWIYPYDMQFKMRTSTMRRQALLDIHATNRPVLGWRGPSVLDDFLSVPEDVVIDYMHQVLLGVTRTFIINICSKKLSTIGQSAISSDFRNICFPPVFNRRLRSLNSVKLWKAAEFKLIVLYGFPCLHRRLHQELFEFFMLLCLGVSILVQRADWEATRAAQTLFTIYRKKTPELLGESSQVFNVHSLLHIPDQARLSVVTLLRKI